MSRYVLLVALFSAAFSQADSRIVAFGDVHGAYDSLIELLEGNAIIDSDGQWVAGETTLVSLGDLVDRGPASRAVMDLLIRLQVEASAAGGEVVVLLGNHEAMNLTGNLRDVSSAEFAAFADDDLPAGAIAEPGKPAGYSQLKHALSPEGQYGSWLLQQPLIAILGETAFVHGGLATAIRSGDLAQTNADAVRLIKQAAIAHSDQTDTPEPAAELLGSNGPLWYRGSAACHELLEAERLQAALSALSVSRLVIGHTPTPSGQPESRFDGALIAMDTGMLTKVYGGQPYLLEIAGAEVLARDIGGDEVEIKQRSAVRLGSDAEEQAIADALTSEWATAPPAVDEGGKAVVDVEGRELEAVFVAASKLKTRRAIAAWQLDRQLGLDFVPLTFAATSNGRRGFVHVSPGRWRTEAQRQIDGRQVPNYCARGHVFDLVTISDALLRAVPRSAGELSYSRRSWDVRLTGHEKSFGRRSRLHLTPEQAALPAELKRRLSNWTDASLNALTNGQLSKSDLRALLARRDALLNLSIREPVSGPLTP